MILTFGHGTADAEEITRLLTGAGVRRLVDVRTAPGSKHNPDVHRDALAGYLPEAGIGYRWERRLGGWRKAPVDTPDLALRNRAFAGYADHMRSADFLAAIDDLLREAAAERAAMMCAETLWWRCHRKMIADFVTLAQGVDVRHLMHDGALMPHRPSAEARLLPDQGILVYDVGQLPLR